MCQVASQSPQPKPLRRTQSRIKMTDIITDKEGLAQMLCKHLAGYVASTRVDWMVGRCTGEVNDEGWAVWDVYACPCIGLNGVGVEARVREWYKTDFDICFEVLIFAEQEQTARYLNCADALNRPGFLARMAFELDAIVIEKEMASFDYGREAKLAPPPPMQADLFAEASE